MKSTSIKILLITFLFSTSAFCKFGASNLYKKYIRYGNVEPKIVRSVYFEGETPEEINLALFDLRKFIHNHIKYSLKNDYENVDTGFLINILNFYGWIIKYLEKASVDPKTKRVFEDKKGSELSIFQYWKEMEDKKDLNAKDKKVSKFHWPKFYGSAADHLSILIYVKLIFECCDRHEFVEMRTTWVHWLSEKLLGRLSTDPTFGGYYDERIKKLVEVYKIWSKKYEENRDKDGLR
jgi:hypothetical protein